MFRYLPARQTNRYAIRETDEGDFFVEEVCARSSNAGKRFFFLLVHTIKFLKVVQLSCTIARLFVVIYKKNGVVVSNSWPPGPPFS